MLCIDVDKRISLNDVALLLIQNDGMNPYIHTD